MACVAFGGSFDHWVHLASAHGQAGILAPAVAICADAGAVMAARERQHDIRIGRKRRGLMSWPTLVLAFAILEVMAGNLAGAQHSALGFALAAMPGMWMLIAISMLERRAAESCRRAVAEHQAAEAEQAAAADLERQREAAERQRIADDEAAAQRQRDRDERQAELAARRAAVTQGVSATVTNPRLAVTPRRELEITPGQCVAPGPDSGGGDRLTAKAIMRAHWDQEVAAGRLPSGADLIRVAGLSPDSSMGRQMAAKWKAELPDTEGADL